MISVVIPLYNKEKAIVGTLDSVLAQTYTNYEVIIVNDGSTDHSQQVVEEWLNSSVDHSINSSFRLINQPNGGVSSARNRGVQEAKGEYIAFLDGDDLWDPTYLEELVKLIADYPNAAIYGLGLGSMRQDVKCDSCNYLPNNYRGVVTDLWSDSRKMLMWTSSSTCVPTNLAKQTLADEHLTHGEDLDVWLQLMLQGKAVIYNRTLAYYVKDAENRAMNTTPNIKKHIVSKIEAYKEYRMQNADFRKAFDAQMVYFLYPYMLKFKYRKEAKRLAKQLDYSQLKWSMHFRMRCPWLYRLYELVKRG
ncbi:MAG: glycosyltransferase family 2 protein [Prevotellaceae bacterium]|nr:glycosyltransferase family 2 protein [Candidatus Colivivens equi]